MGYFSASARALSGTHEHLVAPEVDVLHPQPTALEQAQPRAVEEPRHESRWAGHSRHDRAHFGRREDDGYVMRSLGADDIL